MTNRMFPLATALLLTSTTAMAELAPQDIIKSWQNMYANLGGSLSSAAPVVTGATTRYPDVVTQTHLPTGTGRFTIDYIDIRQNPDGSVDITFSPNASSSTILETGDSPTIAANASYDLGSLAIHAQGTPADINYSYTAPIITFQQSLARPDMDMSMTIALEGLQGTLQSITAQDSTLAQTAHLTATTLSAKLALAPTQGAQVFVDYTADALNISYDLSLPHRPTETSLHPMLFPEGSVFGMTISTGPATTTVDKPVTTTGGKGRFTVTQSSGDLTAAYAENALSYGLTATGTSLEMANTPARPIDFTAAFDRFHLGITLPVRKADIPAPFALALALEGATVGDDIWNRIDPEATLSRAPASFAFSLNGTAKLFVDLFDQTALTALRGAPFEISALDLSALSLDFEGLGLTGDGGVTFNTERRDPASGLPEPTGTLDFSITGALGLLDKIGRLGIGDPMIIIGAKGALGMFATAGDGPDSFTSHIAFTDGGHISVNGQQVK